MIDHEELGRRLALRICSPSFLTAAAIAPPSPGVKATMGQALHRRIRCQLGSFRDARRRRR